MISTSKGSGLVAEVTLILICSDFSKQSNWNLFHSHFIYFPPIMSLEKATLCYQFNTEISVAPLLKLKNSIGFAVTALK